MNSTATMPHNPQSRPSSPKTVGRRPKLMRASATAPSLATSTASRNDLSNLQSPRATALLTRVASYSTAQHNHGMRSPSRSLDGTPEEQLPESAHLGPRRSSLTAIHQSGNYYSFPSFEDFADDQQNMEEERGNGRA